MSLSRNSTQVALGAAFLLLPLTVSAAATEPNTLTNNLAPSTSCENCHDFVNAMPQANDPFYAPFTGWRSSLMGNAARDPVFWAGVAVADADEPGETIDCVRCHSPRAFLEGRGTATSIDELEPADLNGVECELCHRMVDDPDEGPGNARYTIDDIIPMGEGNVPRRGPWAYDDGYPPPPHAALQDAYVGSSELCGTCHDVTTPRERVDDDGNGMGMNFNEQRTYSEWLNSSYSIAGDDFRSCQDCHMPAVADMPGCRDNVDVRAHETGGRRHDLVGANRFMTELLKSEYGAAGTNEIADLYWDNSIERMDEFLATAATMDVEPPASVNLGDGLNGLAVTVTNNTGHKLPSGYSEGRVMWIEVIASYDDEVVFSSGAWSQTEGIEDDPLLHTYEGIAEDAADGTIFHLLLNNRWVEDTRIPPLGLQADIETDPVGDRYEQLGDGTWPNFDEYTYDFDPAPDVMDATPDDATDDELDVSIRLLYLINTPEYMEFLGDNGGKAGMDVATTFDLLGGATPIVLAEESLTIPIDGFGDAGGSSSGGADSTTTGDPTTTGATTMPATTDPTDPTTADDSGSSGGTGEGDDDGDGGCGCRSSDRGPGAALLMLPLLGLLRRRRRA